jgi:photosystem II stability/assembly factor-like uncharacterized protein
MRDRPGFRRLAGLVALAALSSAGCEPRPGELKDQQDRTNGRFRIRVQLFAEGSPAHVFNPGCHLRLLSAPPGSESWRQFGNAYFTECPEQPADRVRFVGDRTAYVFMQWWYVVTTDGGDTWSTWDVPAHLPGRVYYNPRLIDQVAIAADGTGTMTLNPDGVVGKERLTLRTDNFGKSWTAP